MQFAKILNGSTQLLTGHLWTIIIELFGENVTSTVVGMAGSAGAVAGLIINPLIGVVVQNYSYLPSG